MTVSQKTIVAIFIFLEITFVTFLWLSGEAQCLSGPHPSSYINLRFWDTDLNMCYFKQNTRYSCCPATVQMVLMYLDFSPVPSQTELASEMHTDLNHTTEWRYAHIPFENRGFSDYYNQSLSDDFNTALTNLKGNVSQNLPVIMDAWYDQKAKKNGTMTHARVITGYNSTGVFFHDPWSGPNRFLNNSDLCSLWKTDLGYWALIIKSQPTFDLMVEIKDILGLPVSGTEVTLWNGLNHTKLTGANGTVSFYRLSVSERVLRYRWRFQSNEAQVRITKRTECCLIVFSDRSVVALIIIIAGLLIGFAAWNHRRSGYARIWRFCGLTRATHPSGVTLFGELTTHPSACKLG